MSSVNWTVPCTSGLLHQLRPSLARKIGKDSPISTWFKNVISNLLPTVYTVLALKMTCPPLLHWWRADRMFAESSLPCPFDLTVHVFFRGGECFIGLNGFRGPYLNVGRFDASTRVRRRRLIASSNDSLGSMARRCGMVKFRMRLQLLN